MAPPPTWLLAPYTSDAVASTSKLAIPNPPGYSPSASTLSNSAKKHSKAVTASSRSGTEVERTKQSLDSLRTQRAWDLAIGPAKSVPMQGFMMYMSGGGVQIFSLMIVFQLIKGAISGMMSVNNTFEHLTSASTTRSTDPSAAKQGFALQKTFHCLAQCLLLGLGLYKCHSMGLLPTHDSDWLAFSKQRIPLETSSISLGGWWQT